MGVHIDYYHCESDFRPCRDLTLDDTEWLYLINFYGQLSNSEIRKYIQKYKRVIVDQAHAYYEEPIDGVDTMYTCRKWFGVADGAFLYTDAVLEEEFPQDISYDRMEFLLGRYEKTAGEFYGKYVENNQLFRNEPIKRMSKLTANLLSAIDYEKVRKTREENFLILDEKLKDRNLLSLTPAMFMYPFMIENGREVRKKLIERKIFIPVLWPSVFDITTEKDPEYQMAMNILPLPIDQRYNAEDMEYMVGIIEELL